MFETRHRRASTGRELVAEALERVQGANRELRELTHGQSCQTRGPELIWRQASNRPSPGSACSSTSAVAQDRFCPEIEASAYFVVAEALTNVAKHSSAQHAVVAAR